LFAFLSYQILKLVNPLFLFGQKLLPTILDWNDRCLLNKPKWCSINEPSYIVPKSIHLKSHEESAVRDVGRQPSGVVRTEVVPFDLIRKVYSAKANLYMYATFSMIWLFFFGTIQLVWFSSYFKYFFVYKLNYKLEKLTTSFLITPKWIVSL
jgi:hypothetical protein